MKVKNDHCSKFSNLSNWTIRRSLKKNQGFNGIRTVTPAKYRCFAVMGSNPVFIIAQIGKFSAMVILHFHIS